MRTCSALLAAALLAGTPAAARLAMKTNADPVADYAIGTAAFARSDLGEAARHYQDALEADPDNLTLKRAAFGLALMRGDRAQADRLASALPSGGGQDSVRLLLRLVRAFERHDWRGANAIAGEAERAKIYGDALAPIARAWAKFGSGDRAGGLAMLRPETASPGAFAAVAEARARMLGAMGRWGEARQAYAGLLLGGERGVDLRVAAADAAAHMGDETAARELLVEQEPGGVLERAHARLDAGRAIADEGDPTRTGMAALLGALAGELGARQPQAALPFARIATFMAPRAGVETLRLADLLLRAKQYDLARLAAVDIPENALWAGEARTVKAQALIHAERRDAALALLRHAAEARGAGAFEWAQLATAQADAKLYAEAAASFSRAMVLSGTVGWPLWFQRGSAYEQGKDWAHAEPDLRRALALAPRQPIVLNYLGYSLIDRGLKTDEGMRLIQQALEGAANDPAILDSLGWAYYRTGRYADAVLPLERAVAGAPGDASVAEHLGDAYWQVGRRIEARYRWNAAATLDPDAEETARLAAKIDYGLDRAVLAGGPPPA